MPKIDIEDIAEFAKSCCMRAKLSEFSTGSSHFVTITPDGPNWPVLLKFDVSSYKITLLRHRDKALTERYKGSEIDKNWIYRFIKHHKAFACKESKRHKEKSRRHQELEFLSNFDCVCQFRDRKVAICILEAGGAVVIDPIAQKNLKKIERIVKVFSLSERTVVEVDTYEFIDKEHFLGCEKLTEAEIEALVDIDGALSFYDDFLNGVGCKKTKKADVLVNEKSANTQVDNGLLTPEEDVNQLPPDDSNDEAELIVDEMWSDADSWQESNEDGWFYNDAEDEGSSDQESSYRAEAFWSELDRQVDADINEMKREVEEKKRKAGEDAFDLNDPLERNMAMRKLIGD